MDNNLSENTTGNMQSVPGSKFKLVYIILPVLILVIGLGIFSLMKKPVNPTTVNQANVSPTASNSITLAEVGKHADQNSCWIVIEGNVYDATSFIAEHPGGPAILAGCGKDATTIFNGRPKDGTSHSDRARSMLSSLQIGILTQ